MFLHDHNLPENQNGEKFFFRVSYFLAKNLLYSSFTKKRKLRLILIYFSFDKDESCHIAHLHSYKSFWTGENHIFEISSLVSYQTFLPNPFFYITVIDCF